MPIARSSPATAASVVPATPIPFGQDTGGYADGGTSLLVAALLLVFGYAALWLLKRRGWGATGRPEAAPNTMKVVQRVRLSQTCSAYVLQDGENRLLIVEGRQGVQVAPLRAESARERGEAP
jgi:uncharacterized protein (DUF58 family)